MSLSEGAMRFFWYDLAMLAIESNNVVGLRLSKISRGGMSSVEEICLMFTEKMTACIEAGGALADGVTTNGIIDLYRSKVAMNQVRLQSLQLPC